MTLPAISREIVIDDVTPEVAFEAFTRRIGAWWPLGDFGVYGGASTVAFVDGQIVETSRDGQRSVWGTVTSWLPPSEVGFTWHPGRSAERASRVVVTFTAVGTQTLVVLTHDGWEVFDRPDEARTEYGSGWPTVLGAYATVAAGHHAESRGSS